MPHLIPLLTTLPSPPVGRYFLDKHAVVLAKTEAGRQIFQNRSIQLTPRQRSAFILFDGRRSVDDVLGSGMGVEIADVGQLVELGLLGGAVEVQPYEPAVKMPVDPTIALVDPERHAAREPDSWVRPAQKITTQTSTSVESSVTPEQRYQDAYPIAISLTEGLGLRGFRLNLSVEGSGNYQDLLALASKIRAAVGQVTAEALDRALGI